MKRKPLPLKAAKLADEINQLWAAFDTLGAEMKSIDRRRDLILLKIHRKESKLGGMMAKLPH